MGDATKRFGNVKGSSQQAETTPKDQFLSSLERCQLSPRFLLRFYERFMDSSEVIHEKFRFTDFERQVRMLAGSLRACALAISGDREGLVTLNELALSHDRYHHDAKPEWYALWLDALVLAAAEFDPEWSDQLDHVWRHELGYVIQHMRSRY